MSVDVVTFGCRLNTYESEAIRRKATVAGVDDAVIVNTCAVTAEAVRQARQTIRRLKRERPHRRIVVTGCAAQIEPANFAAMAEVDRVVGNEEKFDVRGWGSADKVAVSDIMAASHQPRHQVRPDMAGGSDDDDAAHARAKPNERRDLRGLAIWSRTRQESERCPRGSL